MHPECPAHQEALTGQSQTAQVCKKSRIRSKGLITPLKWQICRNGQPRVDVNTCDGMLFTKHLAIFSWFFRSKHCEIRRLVLFFQFSVYSYILYCVLEPHIPLSLLLFTSYVSFNRFIMCHTGLSDTFAVISTLGGPFLWLSDCNGRCSLWKQLCFNSTTSCFF